MKSELRMNLVRWRDSEMARRRDRDSEIDFFTKRKREKEIILSMDLVRWRDSETGRER